MTGAPAECTRMERVIVCVCWKEGRDWGGSCGIIRPVSLEKSDLSFRAPHSDLGQTKMYACVEIIMTLK